MDRLSELFRLYYDKTASEPEREELMRLVLEASPADLATLANLVRESGEKLDRFTFSIQPEKTAWILQSILGNPVAEVESGVRPAAPVHRLHTRRSWWAAAAILVLLAGGSYFLFLTDKGSKQHEIVKAEPASDVKAPETNRAMITLADGSTVYLDSAGNGQLAIQGNIKLVKLANGQIAYQTAGGEIVKELQYNTLSNPRGSKVIDMQLSDGSHVWLNAGSSVTYPVSFVGSERRVTITGEAYFEVAHHAAMPFKVKKGEMEVTVLGTRFNVNAYEDESEIRVTLLEGSVRVNQTIIQPGQQARVNGEIKVAGHINLEEVMAWKNGLFSFDNADLKTIMRQISTWYDVEVVYQGQISERFRFKVSRNTSAANVFKILEETGFVKFKIQDRKIIVLK